MSTTTTEARRRYDSLTKRIEALDTDIGRTMDSEQRLSLEERRAALVAERDAITAELVSQEKRGNGDLETLQRKVAELARVLASDHPHEAHEIITECVTALGRLDARVLGLEGRVTAIERRITPPLSVTIWRLVAVMVMLVGGSLFWVKESREVLFGMFIWAGVIVEAALVLLAVVCLMMANAKLKEHSR